MANDVFDTPDWRLLRYFSIVAQEGSMRRAADRLFMTQPPLSRHMQRLEEMLGVTLFTRHSKGLSLTAEGLAVLRIARPVLEAQDAAADRLRNLGRSDAAKTDKTLTIGLTTAFEQGVFLRFIQHVETHWSGATRFVRQSSPRLARDVRRGKLDAALVALPLDHAGIRLCPLPYAEPLLAVLPCCRHDAPAMARPEQERLSLQGLSDRPLFWFRRESNPAFFDHMRGVFAQVGFAPAHLEEPEEYDVLLARIAQGEGMGLLPRSFSAIGREGVEFCPLAEAGLLQLRLGLALPLRDGGNGAAADALGQDAAPPAERMLADAARCLG